MVQLQVIKPKAILFDVSGTVTKSNFIDKVLMPFVKDNIRTYLEETYEEAITISDLKNLRKHANTDDSAPKIAGPEADRVHVITTAVAYVNHCVETKKENKALTLLRFHMWFKAYEKGVLVTPVYSDVAIQIQKWRCEQLIKLYVISNGWAEATKRFLERTNHGDMNLLIEDHFDTSIGPLTVKETFFKVLEKIGQRPENVLLLTKSGEEAIAAIDAGLIAVLVITHRHNIDKLNSRARQLPRVRSFNEIDFVEQ